MLIATLAWSSEAWGQKTGYIKVEETPTVTINGTELQNMVGSSGHTEGNVNFKMTNASYESDGSCINLGSTKKDAFTRNIAMTAQTNYTLESVSSVTVRGVGYHSNTFRERYIAVGSGGKVDVSDSSINPQKSDGNYTDVSSTSVSNPIVITCSGDGGSFSYPFHINKVTITYKLSHEEEILRTITITNGTTSSTQAGVDTQGTATANDAPSGYEFLGWDIPETVILVSGNTSSKTIKFNATADSKITALYGKIYNVTVANNVDATTSTIHAGAIQTASTTASDKTGYEFYQWSVPAYVTLVNSTISSSTVTINAKADNQTLRAIYKPIFYFYGSATSSNPTLGTAEVTIGTKKGTSVTEKIVGDVGDDDAFATATFTAKANEDCVFLGWYTSDNVLYSIQETISEQLTNSEIGSTKHATSFFALFKKKQNLQWVDADVDLNLVLGETGYSSAAKVTSSNTITYTYNEEVLTVDSDGAVTTVGLGQSEVTATVAGDDIYRTETISRTFTVNERKVATFTPSWGDDESTEIELGTTATISLQNINENFTITSDGGTSISYAINDQTITITALSAGTTKLTLDQPSNGASLDGNHVTYTIKVTKHPNTFALSNDLSQTLKTEMKVGDYLTGVITNVGNGNTEVSYTDDDESIAIYDAVNNRIIAKSEGTTTITFSQAETDDYADIEVELEVKVTKVGNTLSIELPTLTVDVGGEITPIIDEEKRNNKTTPITAVITGKQSSNVNNGSEVIIFEDGVIKAKNAGTATITLSQAATSKYTASADYTFNITVQKISNAITIKLNGEQKNSLNVAHNDEVDLECTSASDAEYQVSLNGSDEVATINAAMTKINAHTADGTNIWTISQVETYMYEAASTFVKIKVNSEVEDDSYIHTSLTGGSNHSWSTGGGGDYHVTVDYIPSELRFKAWYTNATGVNESVTVVWKDAQGNQLGSQKFWLNRNSSEIHYVYNLPENTRQFSFSATGDFKQYLSDVYVVRKTYIKASPETINLGPVFTDKTGTATFKVEWASSNGGDISIEGSSRFSFSPSTITGTENKNGTTDITLTYTPDPTLLGEENATITISDKFNSKDIKVKVTAKKYTTTIQRIKEDDSSTTVDGTISDAFVFTGTSTEKPTADSNDDFYYTISHTQTSEVNNGTGVISYDPATNTIKGLNAGTARVTFIQKKTELYNYTSESFEFTVTKLTNKTNISLSTGTAALNVDGTAIVELTNNDSKGALSVETPSINYTNLSQNREGGFLAFDGNTNTLTAVNAGTGTVKVTQAETYKYLSKSVTFNVTVNKLEQDFDWDNPDLETSLQIGTTVTDNTASSDEEGLTDVTYKSSNTAVIEMLDPNTGEFRANATGSSTITATQAGNYKYLPASITRHFSVFNKQTPAYVADSHFSGSTGRIELTCTATITVTGVSTGEDFTVTYGNKEGEGPEPVISVTLSGETITITALRIGNATLTLRQEGNDDFIAKTQTYNIEVFWPDYFLSLASTTAPTHAAGNYKKIFFTRTLKKGYSTIALPFTTTVAALTGRAANADDWLAQLSAVTKSAADGYTLYFQKVEGGTITANQPYILHLGSAVENPTWTDMTDGITVVAATASENTAQTGYSEYSDWVMKANYSPNCDMEGKYGVVNAAGTEGALKKGGAGSTLKAYTAYIIYNGVAPTQVKTAYLDEDEADAILELIRDQQEEMADQQIYDLQGRKLSRTQQGVNIIRQKDGTTKKVKY